MTALPRYNLLQVQQKPASAKCERPVILAIGDKPAITFDSSDNGQDEEIVFAMLRDIDQGFIDDVKPDIVVASLVNRRFDCTDVARQLIEAQYRGVLRILSRPLPMPDLVSTELRLMYPELTIELLLIDEEPALPVDTVS